MTPSSNYLSSRLWGGSVGTRRAEEISVTGKAGARVLDCGVRTYALNAGSKTCWRKIRRDAMTASKTASTRTKFLGGQCSCLRKASCTLSGRPRDYNTWKAYG